MKKLNLALLPMLFSLEGIAAGPPHLDLELSTGEYRGLLKTLPREKGFVPSSEIDDAIAMGERLQQWIKLINESRNENTAIRLSSPTLRQGTPIEKPNSYNPATIAAEIKKALEEMPVEMRVILTKQRQLTETLPVDEDTFIVEGRKIEKAYQRAARWRMLIPYKAHYISVQARDVRGYHYLKRNNIGALELREVSLIPPSKRSEIKEALSIICTNQSGETRAGCDRKVDEAFASNTLSKHYHSYIQWGERNWNKFFEIPSSAVRRDVVWRGNTATVPFNEPGDQRFVPYLRDNIEDEFQWGNWGLKLEFGIYQDGPVLIFKPGVTPHVNAIGGNQIFMDANQPIEEYGSQWTIRHEFGHVLGFPDCYHEFYDPKIEAFVNYQLDVTDLMCSRAGDMNERIYKQLEKVYKK